MNKKFSVIVLALVLIFVSFAVCAMRSNRNIIVHHSKTTIVDDEYAVRYRAMIKVVGLSKKDFEFAAKNAFESRRHNIRKYKLELESDGCHPEYKLRMVEAKSMDDINDALDEIDNYNRRIQKKLETDIKNKFSKKISLRKMSSEASEIEEIPCYYDIDISRAKEFEETLKDLTQSRDIEITAWQKPKKITTYDGRKKIIFCFTLVGEISDIEYVLNELDRIFEDEFEDRD